MNGLTRCLNDRDWYTKIIVAGEGEHAYTNNTEKNEKPIQCHNL